MIYDSIPDVEVSPTSVEDLNLWTRSISGLTSSTTSYKSGSTEGEHRSESFLAISIPDIQYLIPVIPLQDINALQSALENRMPAAYV